MQPQCWATYDQAATILGVSPDTVRSMCARGELGHRTIGRGRVYLPDAEALAVTSIIPKKRSLEAKPL